ncbi:probable cytochrome P450 6a23 [Phymastichus coffea]|uniref:probable cytochrome P450 6a23 n=1 Tax=Phymastichus coffea TaxID=108790 RepID=UPI00273AB338|nr:probable cytochrome P450 6a23 [Phymastichus coffea]
MEILPWWLLLFFTLAFIIYRAYINGYLLTTLYGIPFIGIKYPYIYGNCKEQLALEISKLYKKYPQPLIGFRLFFNSLAVIISDLQLVELVLVKNFSSFQNRGLFHNEKIDPLSGILGTVDYEQWKPMRRKLKPAFKSSTMKEIFPQLKNMCDSFVEHVNKITYNGEQVIDIVDTFSRFTTDAIEAIAFGKDCRESAERLREMIAKAKQPYLKFTLNRIAIAFPNVARWLRIRKHPKEVSDFFVNFVSRIVEYRKTNDVQTNDFMQTLIDADLEIAQIAAIAFDFLSAGYADSSSTLAYYLYELAMNKSIQDKARAEIRSILDKNVLSYDVLQKLTYCNQIMKETERKYPVAGIGMRVATKPFNVPDTNITIPRGMRVFIPIYAIHHDERYYPDPEVFDPDRFTDESRAQRPRYSFLPFGEGSRQCIGYKFAEMLIGIGIVSLLQNFEFSICEQTQIPIEFNEYKNTLHPKNGVILKIRRI